MFEKIITQVLNRFLGKFIEDVNSSQIKISLTDGKVKLENMKLRPAIFEALPIPLTLVQGQVGLINILIPITKLKTEAVVIEISDVYALVKPKHIKEWTVDREEEAFLNRTQDRLDAYEAIDLPQQENSKKALPSFLNKYIEGIVDNIQVSVKNVYFRYEDDLSAPGYGDGKFAFGILLKEFSLHNTDNQWMYKKDANAERGDINNKVAIVRNLGIYLDHGSSYVQRTTSIQAYSHILEEEPPAHDKASIKDDKNLFVESLQKEIKNAEDPESHQYLLKNVSAEARVIINQNPVENQQPQISFDVLLGGTFNQKQETGQDVEPSISFAIQQPQITRILKLVEYVGYYVEFQQGALYKYYSYPISQQEAADYIHKYIEYKWLAISGKEKRAEEKREGLKELENKSSYQKIIVLRMFANKLQEQENSKKKEELAINEKVAEKKKEQRGLFHIFASRAKKDQEKKELEEYKEKLEKEFQSQQEDMQNTLYTELTNITEELGQTALVKEEDFDKLPENYIRFSFKVKVPQIELSFYNEFEQQILLAKIIQVQASLVVGQLFSIVEAVIGNASVQDYWTGAHHFPYVLQTQEDLLSQFASQADGSKSLIRVTLERNEKDKLISANKVHVELSKKLIAIVNVPIVKEIQRTIIAATKAETLDFQVFKETAVQRTDTLIGQFRDFVNLIKSGKFDHKSINLTVEAILPVVIIPEDIFDQSRPCIVVDAGRFDFNSSLVLLDPKVDYKLITSAEQLFDKYDAKLSGLNIDIMENGINSMATYDSVGSKVSFIKGIEIKAQFLNCIEPFHPLFPTAELNVFLPAISLGVGLKTLKLIMQIQNSVEDLTSKKEHEMFKIMLAHIEAPPNAIMKSDYGHKVAKDMIYEIRQKAKDIKRQQGVDTQEAAIDEQEMFAHLKKAVNSDLDKIAQDEALEPFIDNQAQLKEETAEKEEGPNFKINLVLESLTLIILDETAEEFDRNSNNINLLGIKIQTVSVNFEINRMQDLSLSASISTIQVESSEQDQSIAKQFRTMASNQPVLKNTPAKQSDNKNSSTMYELAVDDINAIEDTQDKDINNWTLTIHKSGDNYDVKVLLQSLRLIINFPTIVKIMDIDQKRQILEKEQKKEKTQLLISKIRAYEKLLSSNKWETGSQNDSFRQKLMRNQLKLRKVEMIEGLQRYTDSMKKYQSMWERQEEVYNQGQDKPTVDVQTAMDNEVEGGDQKHSKNLLKTQLTKNMQTKETLTKVKLEAKLKSLVVQMPLKSERADSDVIQLNLASEIHFDSSLTSTSEYETVFGAKIRSHDKEFKGHLNCSLNHISLDIFYNQKEKDIVSTIAQVGDDSVKSKQLITTCRVTMSYEMLKQQEEQHTRNNISVDIEPFQIQLGLKDVDDIIYIQQKIDKEIISDQDKQKMRQQNESNSIVDTKINVNDENIQDDSAVTKAELRQRKEDDELLKRIMDQIMPKKSFKMKSVAEKTKKQITTVVRVQCESATISINDDSEVTQHAILYLNLSQSLLHLKQHEMEDNAAIFMLKKMGIFKKLYPEESKSQVFRDMRFFTKIYFNYYNLRSLAYEPLVEPWYIVIQLNQDAPYSAENVTFSSEQMLNINLTYGMIFTGKNVVDKIYKYINATNDYSGQQTVQLQSDQEVVPEDSLQGDNTPARQLGFTFENHTGLDIIFNVHDEDLYQTNNYRSYNKAIMSRGINVLDSFQPPEGNEFFVLRGNGQDNTFKTFDELYSKLSDIQDRKNKGKIVQPIEEDPLQMDVKIMGVDRVASIPIEGLGVFSYTSIVQKEEVYSPEPEPPIVFETSQAKKKEELKRVGIICSVTMDGIHKKVSIQSQLLIANNLATDITICHSELNEIASSIPQEQLVSIKAGKVLRAPVSWLIGEKPINLYLVTESQALPILSDIGKLITPNHLDSKISQKNSKLVRINEQLFSAVNIQAFYCDQNHPEDYPLQYVVSFDSPLKVTNHCFRALEVKDVDNMSVLAQIPPKETAFLKNFDTLNTKHNLLWTIYDVDNVNYSSNTPEFYVPKKMDSTKSEIFKSSSQPEQGQAKDLQFEMQVKRSFFKTLVDYDDSFEFRERRFDFVSSAEVVVYPQYMVVNKTDLEIDFGGQIISPKSTSQYSTNSKNVKLKVHGFSTSKNFDITHDDTQGKVQLTLSKENAVNDEKLLKEYIPKMIELGLTVKQAPLPFNKTNIITITPRYLIINQLDQPIVIKQKGCEEQVVVQDHQYAFNFQEKKEQFLMIRQALKGEIQAEKEGDHIPNDLALDESDFWSSGFQIEDLDDFQVAIPLCPRTEGVAECKWYQSQRDNNYHRFVRVIVTTQDDATLLIVLTNPDIPQYQIQNKTKYEIEFAQAVDKDIIKNLQKSKEVLQSSDYLVGKRFQLISPNKDMPFTWPDRLHKGKRFILKIQNKVQVLNIHKIKKKKRVDLSENESINIEVRAVGNVKVVKITEVSPEKEAYKQANYLQYLVKRYQGQQKNYYFNFRGAGLSLIDHTPTELLHLSLYDIRFGIQQWRESSSRGSELLVKRTLNFGHIQIDNMLNNIMPVLFAPIRPLVHKEMIWPFSQGEISISDYFKRAETARHSELIDVPFVQFQFTIVESLDPEKNQEDLTRVRSFQLSIQEFFLQVETNIIHKTFLLADTVYKFYMKGRKQVLQIIDTINFEDSKNISMIEMFPDLDAKKEIIHDESDIDTKKIFIEYVHLSGIRFSLSLQLEKKAFDFENSNTRRSYGVKGILFSIAAGAACITDSHMQFTELVLVDNFVNPDMLVQQIGKNYAVQAASQLYKLIGSADILGNPIGFIDKLGAGVLEFINGPSQRRLHGPDDLGGREINGVKGLVSQVVIGSLQSVSKVTGTLFTIIKNLTGSDEIVRDQPEDVHDGVHMGLRAGADELIDGAKGLVKKPEEKKKVGGGKGMAVGIGEGVAGAASAPITAALKAGSLAAEGTANTLEGSVDINNNQLNQVEIDVKFYRFRDPRFINTKRIIEPFNQELANAKQVLNSIRNGKYSAQQIRYYAFLPLTNEQGIIVSSSIIDGSMIMITNEMLLYVRIYKEGLNKDRPELLFKSRLYRVLKCEVFRAQTVQEGQPESSLQDQQYEQQGINYGMVLTVKRTKKYEGQIVRIAFQSIDYAKFEKVYDFLTLTPQCEGVDSVRMIEDSQTTASNVETEVE